MTINTATNKVIALGDGSTTQFDFSFVGDEPGYISVIYTDADGNETTLTQGPGPTQYQLSLNAAVSPGLWGIGGTATYAPSAVPIASGTSLTIIRELPNVQNISLLNLSSLAAVAESTETGLDQLEMQIQQVVENVDRVVAGPVSDPAGLIYTLPAVAQRANTGLLFDSNGNVIAGTTLATGIISSVMQPVVDAVSLAAGRTAFGLGTMAVENIGSYGLTDDGSGTARQSFTITDVASNQTITAAEQNSYFASTGNIAFALPAASTIPAGESFGFFLFTISGSVELTPDSHDNFNGYSSGVSVQTTPNSLVFVTTKSATDGAWYITPTGWLNAAIAINAVATVGNQHNGTTLNLGGGSFFNLTFPAASTLDPHFKCVIVNTETGMVGKGITGVLGWAFTLYPGQSYLVFNDNGTLRILDAESSGVSTGSPPPRRYKYNGINLYVNSSTGSDNMAVADGLSTSTPFKTIQQAFYALYGNFDHAGGDPTINLSGAAVYNESVQLSGQPLGTGVFFINGPSAQGATWRPASSATPYCFLPGDGTVFEMSNIEFDGNSINSIAIQYHQWVIGDLNAGMGFGSMGTGAHLANDGCGACINLNDSYAVNGAGGAGVHVELSGPAIVSHAGGITVSITNSPNIGEWFQSFGGQIAMGAGVTWSGSPLTGCKKWSVGPAGYLSTSGNSANIPGSVAGAPAGGATPTSSTGWVT